MHQDNGVPSQQHRPTEETAQPPSCSATANGKPASNSTQSTLASTTSSSVSRDKRTLEVSRRRRQSSAKSTTSSSSSSVGKLDNNKDSTQSAVRVIFFIFYREFLYSSIFLFCCHFITASQFSKSEKSSQVGVLKSQVLSPSRLSLYFVIFLVYIPFWLYFCFVVMLCIVFKVVTLLRSSKELQVLQL